MFNKPHPRSILAHADKETRAKISKGQKSAIQDERSMEAWARNGFVSGLERIEGSLTSEERDG